LQAESGGSAVREFLLAAGGRPQPPPPPAGTRAGTGEP
jgi:hypothetical protein